MASTTAAEAPAAEASDAELTIGGMTCASCAARVEKKLNRMDGVTATVNYATEKARVSYGAGTTLDDLVATVEVATPPCPSSAPHPRHPSGHPRPTARLHRPSPPGTGTAGTTVSTRRTAARPTTPATRRTVGPTRPSPLSGSASWSRRSSPCR